MMNKIIKKIKNDEWKYNFIDNNWKLLSKKWFDYARDFSEWFSGVYIKWKW